MAEYQDSGRIENATDDVDAEMLAACWDGLDLKNFMVIHVMYYRKKPVILMYKRSGGPYAWCAEYRGGGRYFDSFPALMAYTTGRFFQKRPLSDKKLGRLLEKCAEIDKILSSD